MQNEFNFKEIILFIICIIILIFISAVGVYDCGRKDAISETVCKPGITVSVDTYKYFAVCQMPDGKMEVRKY